MYFFAKKCIFLYYFCNKIGIIPSFFVILRVKWRSMSVYIINYWISLARE